MLISTTEGDSSKSGSTIVNVRSSSSMLISMLCSKKKQKFEVLCSLNWQLLCYTVEPRFNEPLFNEVLDITNDIISMSRPKLQ